MLELFFLTTAGCSEGVEPHDATGARFGTIRSVQRTKPVFINYFWEPVL